MRGIMIWTIFWHMVCGNVDGNGTGRGNCDRNGNGNLMAVEIAMAMAMSRHMVRLLR